jgi:hypothetical protein
VTAPASGEPRQPRVRVYFGDSDVGAAIKSVSTRSAVNELASAEFMLDLALAPNVAVDFFAEVRVVAEHAGMQSALFTGNVVAAEADGVITHVRCGAGVALEEHLAPPLAAADVRGVDMLYLILRSVGFTEDRMQLDGLDELPVERFELTVPVDGATAQEQKAVGDVQLLIPAEVEGALNSIDVADELASRFIGAPLYARAFEVGARGFDVEQQALREIDTALAWLGVRANYGLARLPTGDPVNFRRAQARGRPTRRDVVLLRGLETGRRWIRVIGVNPETTILGLDDESWFVPPLPAVLSPQDRQALLACRRAAEGDPLGRINALWDAIEFYVANTKLPGLFSPTDMKAIRAVLPAGLSQIQLERLEVRLAELNAPPLLARLAAALEEDEVPISRGEISLLQHLRHLRNAAVHGRTADVPRADELERATSIISRMLAFRFARRIREASTSG